MNPPEYICLWNPHSQEWLLFNYVPGKEEHAPNYGCPIYNGRTPEDCISGAAEMFDIDPETVEVA